MESSFDMRQAPHISREAFEQIVRNPALLPDEKAYVLNRAVGEYSAYAVLDHLRAVEENQRSIAREELGESWTSIDTRTRNRYHHLMSVLDAVSRGEEAFRSFMSWNWLTLRAMDSFREAARESDDVLERVTGAMSSRVSSNEALWRLYRSSTSLPDGHYGGHVLRAVDVDARTLTLAQRIRLRYSRELGASTPFMNQYADAACLSELSQMYVVMENFGRRVDPAYVPSEDVEADVQKSVISVGGVELLPEQSRRPTHDDIIDALQSGTFDSLADRTIMPEEDFDELVTESIDMYVESHAGDVDAPEKAEHLMNLAEQGAGRHINWVNTPTQQKLRDVQVAKAEWDEGVVVLESVEEQQQEQEGSAVDPFVAEPLISSTEVSEGNNAENEFDILPTEPHRSARTREDEELIESLEHSHYLDEDEANAVDHLFDAGDAQRARELLKECEEEAEQDAEDVMVEAVQSTITNQLLLESSMDRTSVDALLKSDARKEAHTSFDFS